MSRGAEANERKWTNGPWELCHHLKSAESDRSCPCGYRGSIWGSDGNHVVCEMGVYAIPGEEGMQPDRYDRATEIANAQLIVKAPDMATLLRGLADVNMQTRDDGQKLRELAEWRIDAIRLLKEIEKV